MRLWFGLMLSQVIPLIRLMMSYTITLIVVMLGVGLIGFMVNSRLFFVIIITIDIALVG